MKRFFESPNYFGHFVIIGILGGFVLQIAVPAALSAVGAKNAALWSVLPGLLPILMATHGWFAGLAPLGVAILWGINTVAYGGVVLAAMMCCRRWKLRGAA